MAIFHKYFDSLFSCPALIIALTATFKKQRNNGNEYPIFNVHADVMGYLFTFAFSVHFAKNACYP
jgi:hypothetical protein